MSTETTISTTANRITRVALSDENADRLRAMSIADPDGREYRKAATHILVDVRKPHDTTTAPDRNHWNRKAFAIAKALGLTDDERRELAMMLPTRSGASGPISWADLDAAELDAVASWLEGAQHVVALFRLRVAS